MMMGVTLQAKMLMKTETVIVSHAEIEETVVTIDLLFQ